MTIPFFAEIPSAITELFNGQAQWPDWQNVWEPLRRLSDYLHSTTQSNIEAIFETGRPLPHTGAEKPLNDGNLREGGKVHEGAGKGSEKVGE